MAMASYGQPPSQSSAPSGAHLAQQAHPQQQPFKGTLAPGTRVQVGSISTTVSRYLSEGGFAHVYLVTTTSPIPMPSSSGTTSSNTPSTRGEYTHVLKRMAVPDKEALTEVRAEVEVHKLLRNQPHIVHFIEASATSLPRGGYEIFILMEFCSGGGIIDLMNARLRDRLREDEVLKIFADVCNGLSVMHHLDPPMMHRDLKVENILLAPPSTRGGTPTYKLCDFGSASPVLSRRAPKSVDEIRRVEQDLNKHTTLQYRAPEMVDPYQRRVIDEKADIWALGVLLYKLCYYTTPFEENGGGPLAILNARYRFPPHPPYSQRIKDLIASLLQEQSAARPSIDEVLIRTHSLLGTKPPASALHYAQQAAAGKIATPLPSVLSSSTSTSSGADLEARRIAAVQSQSSDAADLIRLGPSEAERAKAEAEALRQQNESITPMRRGRPGKVASSNPTKPVGTNLSSASCKPVEIPKMNLQLTGDRSASTGNLDHGDAWEASKPPSGSFSKAAGASDSSAASGSGFGFGDSFQPSLSPSITAASMSRVGSGHGTPIRHSPALPGFNPSPSPNLSPLPSPPSESASSSMSSLNPTLTSKTTKPTGNENPEASSRFPSVEELDAKYASPPPSSASRSPISIPGSESRASLSSIAGRFERPSSSSTSESASVSRRWPPVGGSSSASLSAISGDSKIPPSSSRALRAKGSESNRHSMFPSSSSSTTLSPNVSGLKPTKSSGALRSSITGDSFRNAPALPDRREIPAEEWITEGEKGASSSRSGLSPGMESLGKAYKSPSRYNSSSSSKPSTSHFPVEKPDRRDSTSSSDSSGDEGPEELDSRKRFSQLPSHTSANSTVNRSYSTSRQRDTESQHPPQSSVQSLSQPPGPGKVKAPAWVLNKGSENLPPPSLPAKDRANAVRAAKLGAAEDMGEASRGLERDVDGEPIAPLASDTESSVDQAEEESRKQEVKHDGLLASSSRAQARAPTWDEDDEEQTAMRNDRTESNESSRSTSAQVGTLVDLSSESRQASLSSKAPTKHLLDQDDPPMEESQPVRSENEGEEEITVPEEVERTRYVASPSPASPQLVAPRAKPLSSSRSNVGGILSRYESISSGLSEAPPLPRAETKPTSFKSKAQDEMDSDELERRFPQVDVEGFSNNFKPEASNRRSAVEERRKSNSPTQFKREPESGLGFVSQRQRSLLNDSNPSTSQNGNAHQISSSSTGSQSINRNQGSISRGVGSSASRSETAPVSIQPPPIASKTSSSIPSKASLKPWEREAAELEEINRQGGVRNSLRSDSDDIQASSTMATSSPKLRETQISSPAPEKSNFTSSRPGHSIDGGNERSSSVGNLISQWQKNAESSAPGWGMIGNKKRLPGTDV